MTATPTAGERPPEETAATPSLAAARTTRATPADPALAYQSFERANQALTHGQFDEAERHLRKALAAQPDHLQSLCNLGALLKDRGRPVEAETYLSQALALQPRTAAAAFNLGLLRLNQRRWYEAVALLREAASAQPKDADAHYWLGNAQMGFGNAASARKAYQAALRRDPRQIQARWGLTMAQLPAVAATETDHAASVAAFGHELSKLKAWFRAQPALDGSGAVGAQQPYYLAYREANHSAALADYGALCTSLMAGWARRASMPESSRGRGHKWRIGIVSAHVHNHSVWHALLRGWVEHLDPERFELYLFHTGSQRDAETEWAAKHVARLDHGVGDWKAWARRISDSQLDALLYPEIGMDATTVRLASLRLARLQLASWGHPITSGLPTIDGYVSAQAFEPEGADGHYTERLLTLPRLGCCYQPYRTAPASVDFTAFEITAQDRVLLCAGVPFKYAPQHDTVLVEIARRCSPCKLVFFSDPSTSLADQLRQRLRDTFLAADLDPEQTLRFVPWQSQAAFFSFLDRADVYLDSLGFSGFNTAMQAMERGTPIVAYEGRFMRGRFASAILRQAGLDAWVADTPAGFVDLVERLLTDGNASATLRCQLAASAPKLYGDHASVTALGQHIINGLSGSILP